jgi:serine/threonine protein kinase
VFSGNIKTRQPKKSAMPQTDRIDSLPSGSELHGYTVDRVLGSGAFGITYLAKHKHLETLHVIKEYIPDCAMREHNRSTVSPKSVSDRDLFTWGLKCFFDEAKLLHQLSHPHIVKVTDLFEANGTAYFVMPYLKGITFHEWMKNHSSPSQDELEAIYVPLLEGLKFIHDKGLLHRDVKPENIYILENGHPILIDFGSARIAIGEKSKSLTQVLTPHFAPWEQYRSKGKFTPALDLYSLSACMYQAITGKLPEEAPERIEEDLQLKLVGSEHEKWYSSNFLQAIDKSLSVHARDRHQDGFDLQKDLVGQKEEGVTTQEHFFAGTPLGGLKKTEKYNNQTPPITEDSELEYSREYKTNAQDSNLHKNYINLDDYIEVNRLPISEVIAEIKSGKWKGKYIDGSWYILYSEVFSSTLNADTSRVWLISIFLLIIFFFVIFLFAF